ncbi:MAG: hypothetical protein ABUS49_00685 [Acidobacteriota bacterium]
MICIKCNQPQAHRSHRTNLKDRWYRLFRMIPYRCRGCKARFYAYRGGAQSDKMRTGEERRIIALRRRIRWKRTKKELAIYGAGIVIFISVLFMLIQQRIE